MTYNCYVLLGSWLCTQNLWGEKSVLFTILAHGQETTMWESESQCFKNLYLIFVQSLRWGFTVKFFMVCLHIYVTVFCKNVNILACILCPFCSVWLTRNEVLNDLYSSPSIFRVIKSRRMSWAGHVARMGEGVRLIQDFGGETWGKETTWETQA